jgi:hypothetical protein
VLLIYLWEAPYVRTYIGIQNENLEIMVLRTEKLAVYSPFCDLRIVSMKRINWYLVSHAVVMLAWLTLLEQETVLIT